MVRRIIPFLLTILVACSAGAAPGIVHLRRGDQVSGNLVRLNREGVRIRTRAGVRDFPAADIESVTFQVTDIDGSRVTRQVSFQEEGAFLPFTLETPNFVIKTDIGPHVCRNAGQAMEQLYREFQQIFGVPDGAQRKKTELLIFEKEDDFRAYAEELGANLPERALGFYRRSSDGRSQIVAYKRRTEEHHTLSTLYHEATHHFLGLALRQRPPLWLDEGLAVYFETSRWQNGRLVTGVKPRIRLMQLQHAIRQDRHHPLDKLMTFGRAEYDSLAYAQGWSLVYFLMNYAGQERFARYMRKLREGEDPEEAFKTSFTRDIDRLERAWKEYVLQLELP